MERGDLQEPGERINSAKEFSEMIGLTELKTGPYQISIAQNTAQLSAKLKRVILCARVRLPKIKAKVT